MSPKVLALTLINPLNCIVKHFCIYMILAIRFVRYYFGNDLDTLFGLLTDVRKDNMLEIFLFDFQGS